jgi:mannosyltransferase OCH1-like enzyme
MAIYNDVHQKRIVSDGGAWTSKSFHRIWLGRPMPDVYVEYGRSFRRLHPDWRVFEWSEQMLSGEDFQMRRLIDEAMTKQDLRLASDLIRLEIVYRYGGIYLDTDFEALKNFDETLVGWDCFLTAMTRVGLANGCFGAEPGHPFVQFLIDRMMDDYDAYEDKDVVFRTGPSFFTRSYKIWVESGHTAPKVFEPKLFYPYSYKEMHRQHEEFPDSIAVHHWGHERLRQAKRDMASGKIEPHKRTCPVARGFDRAVCDCRK